MATQKPKPKKKSTPKPDQYPAAFMDAIRKSLTTPKPKGGWGKK